MLIVRSSATGREPLRAMGRTRLSEAGWPKFGPWGSTTVHAEVELVREVAQRSSRSASTSRSRSHTGAGLKAIFVHAKIVGATRVQGIWLFFCQNWSRRAAKEAIFCQNDKKSQKNQFLQQFSTLPRQVQVYFEVRGV